MVFEPVFRGKNPIPEKMELAGLWVVFTCTHKPFTGTRSEPKPVCNEKKTHFGFALVIWHSGLLFFLCSRLKMNTQKSWLVLWKSNTRHQSTTERFDACSVHKHILLTCRREYNILCFTALHVYSKWGQMIPWNDSLPIVLSSTHTVILKKKINILCCKLKVKVTLKL